ncbi:MAG: SusC/RagA family TonB-linked outer membrane protein [Prolixibacteraceae bacterium]
MEKKWKFFFARRRLKLLIIMKLLSVLLLAGSLSLSAAIKAQNAMVSLHVKNASFEEILWEIQEQTNLQFLYSLDDVEHVKGLNLDNENRRMTEVLNDCMKGTNLEYQINDQTVIIQQVQDPQKKEPGKSSNQDGVAVSGKIVDKEGIPIPGASISVKANAFFGTISDSDGNFSLNNIPKKSILVVSFMGYNRREMDIARMGAQALSKVQVILEESSQSIDEIVVTGTGSQRKASIVGAISTLRPEELRTPTRSLSTQLAGKVAGVTFVQSSGQPGRDGASFIIRGINSATGNSSPLILIDGLKRDIDDVDPNDVESFSVLKDASATAIYGLEGANGIIVITTKNGKASARPLVRVSLSSSVNNSTYKPDWVDAYAYAQMRNEAAVSRGKDPFYNDDVLAKFQDDDQDFYPNVDWYKALYKPNNLAKKGNFNIGGGGNVVTYYMSGGFYTEDGMFKGDVQGYDSNAKYSQFNFRSNLKADISPTTTLGLGFDGRYNTTTEPGQGAGSILDIINTTNPTLFPAEYSNGTAPIEDLGVRNPFSVLNKTGFKRIYQNVMSTNINLVQKLDFITKGLFFNGVASFSKVNNYEHRFIKDYEQHRIDFINSYNNSGYDENGNLMTINATPNIDDKMRFEVPSATGNRTVELQGSINYSRTFFDNLTIGGLLIAKQREYLDDKPEGSGGQLLINALAAREQSIAGRATLDYKNRYFMDINFGASGSQLFTPENRWSSFPSIGIGWMISDETFWAGVKPTIDMLKLRASYGVVGAPGSATRYGYLGTTGPTGGYTFGFGENAFSGESIGGVVETRLEQLGLTWEQNYKFDFGFELGLVEDMSLIIDFFRNTRKKQLIDMTRLPATLGLPAVPKANQGENYSEGVDIDLTYNRDFGDFKINYIKGILTYNRNVIVENGQLDPKVPYQSGIGLDYGRSMNYIVSLRKLPKF